MRKKMSSDLSLKIFSVLIAISLWFYVVQVQNPDMNRTLKGVPVVFTQQEALAEKGLVFLNDSAHVVDVKIRGSRKYVTGTKKDSVTVLADVSQIESPGRHVLVTTVVLPYANLELLSKSPATLTVEVDDLVTVEKPIEIVTQGTPKSSYVVGETSVKPEKVTIKGPKTIIEGIRSLAVYVDVNGKSSDVVGVEEIVALGDRDKEIKNQLLDFSIQEADIHVEILKSKTVSLELVYQEDARELLEDYVLDTSSVSEFDIAGVQALVDKLSKVKTKPISARDINEDGEVTVTLDLPQGVRSLDGEEFKLRFSRRLPE